MLNLFVHIQHVIHNDDQLIKNNHLMVMDHQIQIQLMVMKDLNVQ